MVPVVGRKAFSNRRPDAEFILQKDLLTHHGDGVGINDALDHFDDRGTEYTFWVRHWTIVDDDRSGTFFVSLPVGQTRVDGIFTGHLAGIPHSAYASYEAIGRNILLLDRCRKRGPPTGRCRVRRALIGRSRVR